MNRDASGLSQRRASRAKQVALMVAFSTSLGVVVSTATAQQKNKGKDGINVSIQSKDGTDAGLVISGSPTAKEVGLPIYPGAKLHKDEHNDTGGVKLGLWGSLFGFKVVVLKLESGDAPQKVAAFYQKALGKYGKVLDCTNNPAGSDDKDKDKKSHALTCQDDRPEPGGMMFKSGSKEKQHIVGIQPNGAGSLFQLVYLEAHDDEDKEPA